MEDEPLLGAHVFVFVPTVFSFSCKVLKTNGATSQRKFCRKRMCDLLIVTNKVPPAGPLRLVVDGEIGTPINGRKSMGNWGEKTLLIGVI